METDWRCGRFHDYVCRCRTVTKLILINLWTIAWYVTCKETVLNFGISRETNVLSITQPSSHLTASCAHVWGLSANFTCTLQFRSYQLGFSHYLGKRKITFFKKLNLWMLVPAVTKDSLCPLKSKCHCARNCKITIQSTELQKQCCR